MKSRCFGSLDRPGSRCQRIELRLHLHPPRRFRSGTTLRFQHSANLTDWTEVTIAAASNLPTVQVFQNASADAITVTIPKSVAPGGKLFGRLKVTQP